ncbi:exopolyphosphatase [soil metagenome]
MLKIFKMKLLFMVGLLLIGSNQLFSQGNFNLKFRQSTVYAGIEVGSKGVKMSVLEIGKNAQKSGAFNALKDTSINTDFISFSAPTFTATLDALQKLYSTALKEYNIPSNRIFSVVSSGVKMQADKEGKKEWVKSLSDSFSLRVHEPNRFLSIIDVAEEARLSHLGIVPDARRYSTFLIDIGSGNTKGGYFPNGNTKEMKLFQLNWGTKSTTNATEKRCEEDKSINNFSKQLYRVLAGAANNEVIYAVNESGAYAMSDYIAFSGGISWSVATLLYPELNDNPVVPVTYNEVENLYFLLLNKYSSLSSESIVKGIHDKSLDKAAIAKEIETVHKVFDQRALMAGTGLLLKIMRQFTGVYEKKQFYLVKNGQVGWISAYVNQSVAKH